MLLLWLWCRPAATAPIRSLSLAWETPYAFGMALKQTKDKRQKKKKKKRKKETSHEKANKNQKLATPKKKSDNGYPSLPHIKLTIKPQGIKSVILAHEHTAIRMILTRRKD